MYETSLNSVKDLLGDKFQKCESPSLRLNKLLRLGENTKKEEIDFVCICAQNHQKPVCQISPNGSEFIYAKLLSRLIVNQAGGILENSGLCLHRYFGYPMIPGSALKGLASHAAWCEWNDIPKEDSSSRLALAEKIAFVFGYPTNHKEDIDKLLEENGWKDKKYSGSVCFMDAVPYDCKPALVTDIITSHHKDYYGGKEAKALDNEQPIPIPFIAVESGATFKITLVPLARCNAETMSNAKKWLIQDLTVLGVGAKTAAGYGWFEDVTNNVEKVKEEERAKKEREERIKKETDEIKNNLVLIEYRINELESIVGFSLEHRKKFEDIKDDLEKYNGRFNYQFLRDKLNKLDKLIPKVEETYKDKLLTMNDKEILDNAVKLYDKRKPVEQEDIISYFMNEGKDRLKKYNSGNLENNKSKSDKQKCSTGLSLINTAIKARRKGV